MQNKKLFIEKGASHLSGREFFALLPVLTIHGWAWLTDVHECFILDPSHRPEGKWLRYYRKVNRD